MLQTQEQRPGKAAEVTIPGPQNQNANVLEPGFSTHLHPQFRHHREWGVGPPWHGVGMDMAHWGPAAGPHARGASEEREQAKVLEEGRARRPGTQEVSSQCERQASGEDPTCAQGTPAASRQQGTVALPFPPVSTDPRTPALSSRQSLPPFMSKSSRVSTFQCSLLREGSLH